MLKKDPWEGYIKPAKMVGNLYFVGTKPASTHIIDTGDGLILIDPGYQESLYLVLHNMWELGLDPKNIRYILLTHAHYDHTDAGQNDTVGKLSRLGTEADNPFVAPTEWKHFIANCRKKLNQLNEEDPY